MKNIIGVRFKKPGKIYFFDPGDLQVDLKDLITDKKERLQ